MRVFGQSHESMGGRWRRSGRKTAQGQLHVSTARGQQTQEGCRQCRSAGSVGDGEDRAAVVRPLV